MKKKCPEKVYLCKPEKLFTIREGAIVELNKNYVLDKPVKREDKLQTFICIDYKNQNDQIHSRLSEEEIKKIPKFQNYEKGMPSSVRFLHITSSIEIDKECILILPNFLGSLCEKFIRICYRKRFSLCIFKVPGGW